MPIFIRDSFEFCMAEVEFWMERNSKKHLTFKLNSEICVKWFCL